jgi:hypothetical protein
MAIAFDTLAFVLKLARVLISPTTRASLFAFVIRDIERFNDDDDDDIFFNAGLMGLIVSSLFHVQILEMLCFLSEITLFHQKRLLTRLSIESLPFFLLLHKKS